MVWGVGPERRSSGTFVQLQAEHFQLTILPLASRIASIFLVGILGDAGGMGRVLSLAFYDRTHVLRASVSKLTEPCLRHSLQFAATESAAPLARNSGIRNFEFGIVQGIASCQTHSVRNGSTNRGRTKTTA